MKIFHDLNEKCHVLTGKGTAFELTTTSENLSAPLFAKKGQFLPLVIFFLSKTGKGRVGGILRMNAALL